MPSKIMSFGEFERIYEANKYILEDESAVEPPKDDEQTSVVSDDGSIGEKPSEILDLLKDLGGKEGEGEAAKEEAPNESLEEQSAFVAEATPVPVKKPATKPAVNTLKPAKMGEESERVKEIQKTLEIEVTGKFDQATKDAVIAFQAEQKKSDPKIVTDGIVGPQTYGLLLKVKKGLTDAAEIAKQIEAFKQAGKMVISVSKGKSIALDPRFYDVFERIEIITNNGTTYVVATPKADAAAKVEALKKDNLIGAGFEWLLAVPLAVGKALVYTAVGVTVITVEVAKAMVNAAISAGAFVAKGLFTMASNVFYGIGQIAKWTQGKAANIWTSVKQSAEDGLAVWRGFVNKSREALKSTGEGLLAFAASVGASLSKGAQAFRNYVHKMAVSAGKTLNYAWEQTKNLGELVKSGLAKVANGAKALVAKVQTAYDAAVTRANAIGNAVVGGLKKAGNAVVGVAKSAISAAGDFLISSGNWLKSLVESLETGNGELVLEWLEY